MSVDNTSSNRASEYDAGVRVVLPYYDSINDEIIHFVRAYDPAPRAWLDTGCGTGFLATKILESFAPLRLVLADPSAEMLRVAKEKTASHRVEFHNCDTSSLPFDGGSFDVITAVQSHHYMNAEGRAGATKRCFDMLREGGLFIATENTRPPDAETTGIVREYWKQYQIRSGKTPGQAEKHMNRFDTEYFPITVEEHLRLYAETGFRVRDVFWKSYMQAAFYCVK
jgi:tRNA (cmo5U34)-methyltransferase